MGGVRLESVTKGYGQSPVVDNLTMEVRPGELLSLLGPSGCGKTTTLNMVAGFIQADRGRIEINRRDVTGVPPYRRNTAMVFQNYALFPHLDVVGNVGFGLRMRGAPAGGETRRRVDAALALVKMTGFEQRMPRQLSGGQQQRVALARALVVEPDVLLLDEPLSNLDAKLREEMRLELRQLQRQLAITTIFVTHDQEEAFAVSDRVAVMHKGRIEQLDAPERIYRSPASATVADFIGRMNWIPGEIDGAGVFVSPIGDGPWRTKLSGAGPRRGHLLVRPESVILHPGEKVVGPGISAMVEACIYLGPKTQYHLRAGATPLIAFSLAADLAPPVEGQMLTMRFDPAAATFLPDV